MARQSRPDLFNVDRPVGSDPAAWALWRLSMILAEIAQSKSTDCEAEAQLDQTSVPKILPKVESGG